MGPRPSNPARSLTPTWNANSALAGPTPTKVLGSGIVTEADAAAAPCYGIVTESWTHTSPGREIPQGLVSRGDRGGLESATASRRQARQGWNLREALSHNNYTRIAPGLQTARNAS